MNDGPPNVWTFLISLVTLCGVIGGPLVTWVITRKQTATITANNADAAQEVKAELAVVAKQAEKREVKLDAVHSLVNGDRLAKQRRIEELEAKMRAAGLDPET